MATAKKDKSYRLLTAVLVIALLVYIGFQVYRSIFDSVTTELAVVHSVYESIETKGLVFRSETIIPAVNNGHTFYAVESGTRVSKGGVIASVYASADDGLLERRIAEIDQQIADLRAIGVENSTEHLSLDLISSQLASTVNDLVMDVEDGSYSISDRSKADLLSLLSKKQIITGTQVNLAPRIAELQNKRATLVQQFQKATSRITAPVAGYFADRIDGYESMLGSVDPTKLTVEELAGLLEAQPTVDAFTGGKIVSGYEWYMGCVVPESYYNALAVGTSLSLRMSFVTDDEIPVKVASCRKDNNGKLAVIFRCAYMSEALSTIRNETVEIQLVRHTGLKVPKRAVVIADDMQAGVYIRSGNVVSFRKIDQTFSEPADYVICSESTEPGYLKLYDDIIVEGRGLYEGKIIH